MITTHSTACLLLQTRDSAWKQAKMTVKTCISVFSKVHILEPCESQSCRSKSHGDARVGKPWLVSGLNSSSPFLKVVQ